MDVETSLASPSAEPRSFWDFEDLALLIGAVLPSLALAALLTRAAKAVLPGPVASDAARTLAFQSLFYGIMMGALYLLISFRHRQPFWKSLGWTWPYPGRLVCVVAGPVLAIALSALGAALHAPETPSAVEKLVTDTRSLVLVVVFGTIFGPAFEELVFRGFLLPLLVRVMGVWPGIVLTAVPFAVLHGPQNQWIWQDMLIIGLAGVAFGYARQKTGSTLASTFLHLFYNLTFFAGFLMQRWVDHSSR